MVTKERILSEIRRTAVDNNNAPLGIRRFEKVTGIIESAWRGRYWKTWSDAVTEAGFEPNVPQERISDDELVLALIAVTRELQRFPSEIDLSMARARSHAVPSAKRFRIRLGNHDARIEAVRAYTEGRTEFDDIRSILPERQSAEELDETPSAGLVAGHVYMIATTVRGGRRFKIGHTASVPRRHREIALELPEQPDVIHAIETDDPAGIESYWHQRFAAKRTNGEWFALTADDVRAFKRRRFM
nr:GIY-YIG nuclease family protein [Kofleriaceae bacterium]